VPKALLPHERANVNVLLGLLLLLPAENYKHEFFGFGFDEGRSPVSGCGLGYAIVNREKFVTQTRDEVPNTNRSFLDRLLGRNKTAIISVPVECNPHDGMFSAWKFGKLAFGAATVDTVFGYNAFNDEGVFASGVTKAMVVKRLTALAA
jgi:hypothetical protein